MGKFKGVEFHHMTDKTENLPAKHRKSADAICEIIANGESLRGACRPDEMPHRSTVMDWVRKYKDFATQYARAREEQAEQFFDDIIDISDDAGFDYKVVDGSVVVDGDAIQRARLRVDSRKWATSKILPKKYGDKLDLSITTEAPPLTIVFNVAEPKGEVRVTKSE